MSAATAHVHAAAPVDAPSQFALEPTPVERLLRASDIGAILSLSPAAVRDAARKGRIPSIKLGERVVRFQLSQVLAALR
jgi:hypothetical protein